ncbi:MAG: IS1380 family transposase [Terriglobia bacterium]
MSPKDIEIIEQRQAESEDRLDRSWMPEAGRPVLSEENLHYEVSARTAGIDCGGLGLVRLLVQKLGLAASINARVKVLRRHLPYRESDHVLNLIYNLMSGGSCLQDVQARRQDVGYLEALGAEKIPAPSTEGDFLRRFEEPETVDELMEAFHEGRVKVWARQPARFFKQATIDADGTMAPTQGECKAGIGLSYDGQWGYHPLVVSLAESNEVLYVLNRPGNRPSHEDAAHYLDRSIALTRKAGFKKVLLRGDTDFTQTRHLDRWSEQRVNFVFGMNAMRSLVRRAEELPETAWGKLRRKKKGKRRRRRRANIKQRLVRQAGYRKLRLVEERVAEFPHQPEACDRTYRMVVVRKRVRMERGQRRLFEEQRYLFYLTNLEPREASPARVVLLSNRRCNQENVVEQLKNGVQAMRMPSDTLESNWAYLAIAAQVWNLKAWLGMVQPHEGFGRQLMRMEFRGFLRQVIQLPCQILRQGRRLIYRLLAVNEWTEAFLLGAIWLKRTRFG